MSTDGFAESGGLVVGWGAPWTSGVIGLGLEGGVLRSQNDYTRLPAFTGCPAPSPGTGGPAPSFCGPAAFAYPSETYVAGYAAATLVFQLPESVHLGPRSLPLHPIALLGFHVLSNGGHSESLDLGIAWNGP